MFNIFKKSGSTKDFSTEMKKLRKWLINKRGKCIKNKRTVVAKGLVFYQDIKDDDFFSFAMDINNTKIEISHASYLEENIDNICFDYKGIIKEFKYRVNAEIIDKAVTQYRNRRLKQIKNSKE